MCVCVSVCVCFEFECVFECVFVCVYAIDYRSTAPYAQECSGVITGHVHTHIGSTCIPCLRNSGDDELARRHACCHMLLWVCGRVLATPTAQVSGCVSCAHLIT